jgi:L-fuculose-phosphate aldolase
LMSASLGAARERVAASARRLADLGLVLGTSGNVSERVGESIAVTPTGAVLAELSAEEVAIVGMSGEHLEGELAATSELALHLGVYERCRAGAVVHTHPPIATALSCVLDELPVIHYQMLELGGPVRVAPYLRFGTPELAEATVEALQDRGAALMSNHGAITHGPDLGVAVERTRLLEWACNVYWHAAAIAVPRALTADQQAEFLRAFADYGMARREG